jgi:hypothetical protein
VIRVFPTKEAVLAAAQIFTVAWDEFAVQLYAGFL